MTCPKCKSSELRIRQATGIEFVVLLFISLRKYRCRGCGHSFRAEDRRKAAREGVRSEAADAVSLSSR